MSNQPSQSPMSLHGDGPAESRLITVEQHIVQQQTKYSPEARGTFSFLLSGIILATKMIQARIRRAGLLDVAGSAEGTNVQGEVQQKLDVFANHALINSLGRRAAVACLVSEENAEAVTFDRDAKEGRYVVVFDPLDGSSNIDVNVGVGTIFSIFRRDPKKEAAASALQSGLKQVAAGYVVYGSSTIFVYTAGHGVYGFTLDPAVGAYILSHDNMKMPAQGSYYSVNEANLNQFPKLYSDYIEKLRGGGLGREYSSRYIGSLVADFHRTLLKGGVFLYPPTAKHASGKLRLLYEANPVAFIAEQAGGVATSGTGRILEIQPTDIHQRTPLIVGSRVEMEEFNRMAAQARG